MGAPDGRRVRVEALGGPGPGGRMLPRPLAKIFGAHSEQNRFSFNIPQPLGCKRPSFPVREESRVRKRGMCPALENQEL